MITQSKTLIRAAATLALTSLIWSAGAVAQQDKAVSDMKRPADNAASCDAMVWHQDFVSAYPWASEACHAVVVVNGENWARFEGKYLGSNRDGSFDTEFVNRSNRNLGRVTLMPEAGQRARISGEDVRFADLERNQVLSFYVPAGATGFAVEPKPTAAIVKTVETKENPVYIEDKAPVQMAQADTQARTRDTELPRTAGPLPIFALGGLLSLLGGLGLTVRRRTSKTTI